VIRLSTQRFKTTIGESATRVFLPIPFDPNDAWGVKQRHHIRGTVNGGMSRGSLGSDGEQYFIPLGVAWRRDNGLAPGNEVEVELWPEGPQTDNLATDIVEALDADPPSQEFFESLATFYRNNYIRWIESAKRPETRAGRIKEMMELLKARQKQK
jgi:hypothetical protein